MSKEKSSFVGRRKFLRLFGIGAATATLAGVDLQIPSDRTEIKSMEPVISPERNLENSGLTEFIPMYQQSKLFYNRWGVFPPIFSDIQTVLLKIAEGDSEIQNIELYKYLKRDWGNRIIQSEEDAGHMYGEKEINFGPEVDKETQGNIKKAISKTFELFPVLAVVSAPVIGYGNEGVVLRCGYDARGTVALGCTDNKSFIDVGSRGNTPFIDTFIHELNHNFLDHFGQNPKVIPYVTKAGIVDYYCGTIALIDRFITEVANDTSNDPAEYTYGYQNWKNRLPIKEKLVQYQEIFGMQPEKRSQYVSANFSLLPEDPQYNLVLRRVLKAALNNQLVQGVPAHENKLVQEFIRTEIGFLYHTLHSIEFDGHPEVGNNINAIIQQFLDLKLEHQRLLLLFISGEKLSGTISTDALRTIYGLSELQPRKDAKDDVEKDFAYEDFGCVSIAKTRSEFITAEFISLPKCPTDDANNYFAIDITANMQPRNISDTILLTLPKSMGASECKLDIQGSKISLRLLDGTLFSINASVISDITSTIYGSVGILNRDIVIDNREIQYMKVKRSKLQDSQIFSARSIMGTVGSLDQHRRSKLHNVPSIAIVDSDGNLSVYADTNIENVQGNIAQFKSDDSADGICIFNTKSGPRLLISCLPKPVQFDDVETLVKTVKEYGVEIVGENKLCALAVKPHNLQINYRLDKLNQEMYGVVSPVIIVLQDETLHVFPIIDVEM